MSDASGKKSVALGPQIEADRMKWIERLTSVRMNERCGAARSLAIRHSLRDDGTPRHRFICSMLKPEKDAGRKVVHRPLTTDP
jgi:hypothetical protein